MQIIPLQKEHFQMLTQVYADKMQTEIAAF